MDEQRGTYTKAKVKAGTVKVNGTEIYHEIRGSGPVVLFIQGATGDGGTFQKPAELLSDQFTVITYDRRANSRSPVPKNWRKTTMDEQADDAAALIKALDLAPAAVFGTSGGAIILLQLIASHPEVLRGAIIHEPAMLLNMPGGAEMARQSQAFMAEIMAKGGPRHAIETFLPMVMGEPTFRNLDSKLRERMIGNAEFLFTIEMPAFASYSVDINKLLRVKVPLIVAVGKDNFNTSNPALKEGYEAAKWLAKELHSQLTELSGAHAPYLEKPEQFAKEIRLLLSSFH